MNVFCFFVSHYFLHFTYLAIQVLDATMFNKNVYCNILCITLNITLMQHLFLNEFKTTMIAA